MGLGNREKADELAIQVLQELEPTIINQEAMAYYLWGKNENPRTTSSFCSTETSSRSFSNTISDGRLLGSLVELEIDFESYFEGVGEEDLKSCFGAGDDSFCQNLTTSLPQDSEKRVGFDLVISR